jgi:hypothetical protein
VCAQPDQAPPCLHEVLPDGLVVRLAFGDPMPVTTAPPLVAPSRKSWS